MNRRYTKIDFLAFFVSAVLSGMIFNYIPFPSQFLYYSAFVVVFSALFLSGKLKINFGILVFVFICFLSMITSDSLSYFFQGYRFFGFLLIILTVSPLISNKKFNLIRLKLFTVVSKLLLIVTIGSFIGFIVGIYSVDNSATEGLKGMSRHSMSLGGFAGLTVIFCLKEIYEIEISKNKKYIYFLIIIIALLTTTLAGSRIALLSSITGSLFFLFKIYKNQLVKFIRIFVITLALTIATSAIWIPYTEVIQNKMDTSAEQGSTTSSRDNLWKDRLHEFEAHPILGSGFGSIDVNIAKYTSVNYTSGTIEPGSSWLFLLSSLGLLGFLCFIILYISLLIKIFNNKINPLFSAWIFGSLGFYTVHLGAEGYITACGEFSFVLIWLTFSMVEVSEKKLC